MRPKTEFRQTDIGMLPRDWDIVSLGNACTKIGSGITPRGGEKVYQDSGVALVRSQNVLNNSFSKQGLEHIDEPTAKEMENVSIEKNDVLLNITGDSVARCCTIPEEIRPARVNQHVCIIRTNIQKLNPLYLQYYLTSPRMQIHMVSLAQSGGTRNALTKSMIEKFVIPRPKLEEQAAMSRILSGLDAKMVLNMQMNKNLEGIAEAIFKRWFIDFEFPNKEDKPYKSSGGEMIGSELGNIPQGWYVDKMSSIMNIHCGGTPRTDIPEYWNGDIKWFTVKDTPKEGDIFVIDTERKITKEGVENSAARILQCGTTVITSRGTVGKLALVGVPMAINQTCYGISGIDGYNYYFIYYLLRSNIGLIKRQTHGTVFDTITRHTFDTIKLIVPTKEVAMAFNQLISALIEKILYNRFESQKITELRDEILPKLVSGQIKVNFEDLI